MDRKAQSSIMEYMLMAFFMLFVIVIIIFFLGWWQFSQLGAEQESLKIRESDVIMNRLINSPLFVIENSVFDDSRLMAMQSLGQDFCDELSPLFGDRWFLEIESLNPEPGCGSACTASNYPCCGYWEICPLPSGMPDGTEISRRALPVNVYRKALDKTEIGVLYAGVYS